MTDAESTADAPVFEWGDPPEAPPRATSTGRGVSEKWRAVARQLKENEGCWAKISEHETQSRAANHATRIRNGKSKAFADGKFDAVHRALVEGEPEGAYGVWAAYLGEGEAADENQE